MSINKKTLKDLSNSKIKLNTSITRLQKQTQKKKNITTRATSNKIHQINERNNTNNGK